MTVRFNQYNSPEISQLFESAASAVAPPSSADLNNYADTALKRQRLSAISKLLENPNDPNFDRTNMVLGTYAPTQSLQALEMDDATKRRGQDITAQTDLTKNQLDNQTRFLTTRFGPLDQGQVEPIFPEHIAKQLGLPAMDAVAGAPKPLSETEWQAGQNQRLLDAGKLSDQDLVDLINGKDTPVKAIGADGKSTFMSPGAAVRLGAQPAPTTPLVNIGPNGEQFGSPGPDLVWARNPDNSIKLDDRGAPIAIPFQGGKLWNEQQQASATAAARKDHTDTQGNVVLQDIDRALSAIQADPLLTTGMGAKVTGWWDGGPAANVRALTDSIRTNVGLDQLQALRAANPNGAGLGNVTEKENAMLQAALGNLEQSQGQQQITDNLNRVKNIFLDIVYGPNQGPMRAKLSFPSQWDNYTAPVADPSVSVVPSLPAGVTEDDVQFTMKKYGVSRDEVLRRLGAK